MTPLLSIRNLSVSFDMYSSGINRSELIAITDISLDIYPAEILAIVGSSGSGKSLLANAIMKILPDNANTTGDIFYNNEKITDINIKTLRGKKISLIPQSASYLDPLMKVKNQVSGVKKLTKEQKDIFKYFDLDSSSENLYPFQLSGGMARRILISTAILTDAEVIIADEPTPGLDNNMAEKTMNIFKSFATKNKAVIIITHDIDLAFKVADKIAIFYAGTVVEIANAIDFKNGIDSLRHPYTKALFNALPQNNFEPIAGFQPYTGSIKNQCVFADRCNIKTDRCEKEFINIRDFKNGKVRCINAS